MKWEYWIEAWFLPDASLGEMRQTLARIGEDRWELVAVYPLGNFMHYVFKREKQ